MTKKQGMGIHVRFPSILACLFLILACIPGWGESTGDFERATAYFFDQKFDMAETLLLRVIDSEPSNALAHSYLGDIFLIKRRYSGALDLYRKSIEIDPGIGENYFRMGQVYYYLKDGPKALEYFNRAIEADGSLRFARYHAGLTSLMLLRDKESTIESWERYLSVAGDDPQYDRIRRAIELLRDPNFVIPPPGSDMTVEEALLLGGVTLEKATHDVTDRKAGHESKKTRRKLEEIYLDDDL
ncbi:MAG: tetratricopeptide repeat protein [Spirochaetes bacterium]|nr:tetratricopeptide repeat protein [Spirochaetota bacterium]